MQTRKLVLVLVSLFALGLAACSGVAAAQSTTPTAVSAANETPRTITVSGSGRAFLTPDIAYINIGVHTEAKDAAQAVDDNNTQTAEVIAALKEAGIADKDIQTTNFSIYPQQQYDQGQPTGEITYVVDNSVYVTVRNLDGIGDLLDAAVAAGANSINGISFDVQDRTAALSDAREAAVSDAAAQAQELAQAAGVDLGAIQSISVMGSSNPPVPVFQARGAGAVAESAASVPVATGQMVVTVEVNVVYAIQ
jgi:uncharacterized protein YggE